MIFVILDDREARHEGFRQQLSGLGDVISVYTVHGMLQVIHELGETPYYLFLDYDIHDRLEHVVEGQLELNGKDAAVTLRRVLNKPKLTVVHSRNPYGASTLINHLHSDNVPLWYVRFNKNYQWRAVGSKLEVLRPGGDWETEPGDSSKEQRGAFHAARDFVEADIQAEWNKALNHPPQYVLLSTNPYPSFSDERDLERLLEEGELSWTNNWR